MTRVPSPQPIRFVLVVLIACAGPVGAEEKRAEGALHAWTEAFLPGAGWVGLDPTNGVFCNHNHITAAVGLMPADVTPVTGSYYNQTKVAATMTAHLELLSLE